MKPHWRHHLVALLLLTIGSALPGVVEAACPGRPAVQILGSGGPIADDGRASSAYVLWSESRALALVDTGGGSHLRVGEAGVDLSVLGSIHLTHLHADHSAGLPALLKSAWFVRDGHDLTVSGPGPGGRFPGTKDFINSLLNPTTGSFRYMSEYLGNDGPFRIQAVELDHNATVLQNVFFSTDLKVSGAGVDHGPVPAVAYRFEINGSVVAFSGDQTGLTDGMQAVAENADLLVIHAAIPRNAGRVARNLHASPAEIGQLAAQAKVKSMVLSHWMQRSLKDMDGVLARVRQYYSGPISVADDLMCIKIAD